jgi:UDP-N-acetylmuramyl pentapeptide phosphotransferase/UDP-N-acetylglucosamine-1-phosphate transferase
MPACAFQARERKTGAARRIFRGCGKGSSGGSRVIPLALAMAVSAAILALVAFRPGFAPRDLPNERSLHDVPIPRAGGWAVWAGWLAAAPLVPPPPGWSGASFTALLAALAALFLVSLADDYRGVAPRWRMAVQVACAIGVAVALEPGAGGGGVLRIATFAFVLVAATNAYNFMDGSDGLAGAMAVTGFSALAAAAALAREPALSLLALVAAAVPFLVRNLPPARVFLGDAGSAPLGFFAGAASLAGTLAGTWPAWFPVLVFLTFLADSGVTLARRALRGERVWEAHRTHYYQRLVQLGAGHRGTLAAYGALMLGGSAAGVACLALEPAAGPYVLAAFVAATALLFAGIDYHWRQRA